MTQFHIIMIVFAGIATLLCVAIAFGSVVSHDLTAEGALRKLLTKYALLIAAIWSVVGASFYLNPGQNILLLGAVAITAMSIKMYWLFKIGGRH